MGREIKRVALDFEHPMHEVWPGFVRQGGAEFPPCTACCWGGEPTGLTREAYAVEHTFYAHQISWGGGNGDALAWSDKLGQVEVDKLVAEKRIGMRTLWDRIELPEPWEMDEGHPIRYRFERNDKPAPTAAEVNAANRGGSLFHDYGHDAISRWILARHRCELLGIPYECPTCKGHETIATDEERAAEEAASEAWEPTEPPSGDGYQLWETVSEGSPISPVFALPGELAIWMTENRCTVNGPMRSVDAALRFIEQGWAPSFISSPEIGFTDGMTLAGEVSR